MLSMKLYNVKIVMLSAPPMFNEEINGDLQLFQQLCAGCYGRLFYTKQQKKWHSKDPLNLSN